MLLSFNSGVSALEQFQQGLNVIANNIANVNTTGFKGSSVDFADTFSQTLGSNAAGSEQVGNGVATAAIRTNYTQGSISQVGGNSNLAIEGDGYFVVKDPTTGATYATRDGQFTKDDNGYLLTSSGMRLQGYTDGTFSTIGDIQINDNSGSGNTVTGYSINGDTGVISVSLTASNAATSSITRGKILLQSFTYPNQLQKTGNNLYSNLTAAGPLSTPSAPATGSPGKLRVGSLEMSNVDLAGELTSLITTQRAYEANSKVITTSDEILQSLVNLKR
jgi:flagellar hook protein FlgE